MTAKGKRLQVVGASSNFGKPSRRNLWIGVMFKRRGDWRFVMGLSYSLRLVVGFEISKEELNSVLLKQDSCKEEGIFHMEDRFNPKTGVKVNPEKVWDKKPKTHTKKWYEINGQTHDFNMDPETLEAILEESFSCHVERFGSYPTGEFTFAFYLNKPASYKEATDTGRYTIYNDSVDVDEVNNLLPKLKELELKLKAAGFNVKGPRVFVAQMCS